MPYSKENRKTWEKERKRKIKEIINNAKNKPCDDCNIKYPLYVMSFDHVRGKKMFGLASAISRLGRSFKKLIEEIEKCDIVCLNCHALRHGGKCGPFERTF